MRLCKKVRDTQQHSHYSTKNNVSMFMIPFMPINIEYAIFNYSKQNKRHLCSKRHTYRQTHGLTENGMTKQNMVDVSSRWIKADVQNYGKDISLKMNSRKNQSSPKNINWLQFYFRNPFKNEFEPKKIKAQICPPNARYYNEV